MIQGLSKAVAVYLAPILSLTGLLLSLFAFLAPTIMLNDRVSLLSVRPSTAATDSSSSKSIDGPSVFMGVIGSCSRPSNDAPINCTTPTITPVYDLSVLPGDAPKLLTTPTDATPGFIAASLLFSALFFVLFTLISFRGKMGKFGATLEKPMLQRISAWIGIFGFMMGLSAFMILRLWFGKAVEDFNTTISGDGSSAPNLLAAIGNGFVMVWVAYAFYTVPLVCSLAKLHATTTPSK